MLRAAKRGAHGPPRASFRALKDDVHLIDKPRLDSGPARRLDLRDGLRFARI